MKFFNLIALLAASLLCFAPAHAGNVTTYPNVTTVQSGDLFFDWQSGTQQNATGLQIKNYITGGGTLSIGTGKTLTSSNTLTFAGTDGSSVAFGTGGTVLYSSGIGSSLQAWSAKLDKFAALASPSGTYVLSSNPTGTLAWIAQSGLGSLTIGTNAFGILSFSSPTLDFTNPVNGNNGLVQLTSGGALPTGLLGGYISVTVQPYNAATTLLGNVTTGTGSIVRSNAPSLSGSIVMTGSLTMGGTITASHYFGDGSGLTGLTSPLTFSGGLTLTGTNVVANIGSDIQAWSANLDSWSTTTPDASFLSASTNAVNTASGLVQLDSALSARFPNTIFVSGATSPADGNAAVILESFTGASKMVFGAVDYAPNTWLIYDENTATHPFTLVGGFENNLTVNSDGFGTIANQGSPVGTRVSPPTLSSDPGLPGQWAYDATFFYFYDDGGAIWRRVAFDPTF